MLLFYLLLCHKRPQTICSCSLWSSGALYEATKGLLSLIIDQCSQTVIVSLCCLALNKLVQCESDQSSAQVLGVVIRAVSCEICLISWLGRCKVVQPVRSDAAFIYPSPLFLNMWLQGLVKVTFRGRETEWLDKNILLGCSTGLRGFDAGFCYFWSPNTLHGRVLSFI